MSKDKPLFPKPKLDWMNWSNPPKGYTAIEYDLSEELVDLNVNDPKVSDALARHMGELFDKQATKLLYDGGAFTANAPQPESVPLTAEAMLDTLKRMHSALLPPAHHVRMLGYPELRDSDGMQLIVRTAQEQRRTLQDVRGPWQRPGRVPSKGDGRKGTRRTWKRQHAPGHVWYYREPSDVLVIEQRIAIVTPQQRDAIMRAIDART